MDRCRNYKRLLIFLLILVGFCAGAIGDKHFTGDLYLTDDNWIGLGSSAGRMSFDDVASPDIDVVYVHDADWGGVGVSAAGYTPSIFSSKDTDFTKYIMMHYYDDSNQAIIAYNAAYLLWEADGNPVFRLTTSSQDTLLYGNLDVMGNISGNLKTGGTDTNLYTGESEVLVVTLEDSGDALFSGTVTVTNDYATVAAATGAWELDGNGDSMPVTGSFNDINYDLDSNDDLMPTILIYFESDTSGDLMPTG